MNKNYRYRHSAFTLIEMLIVIIIIGILAGMMLLSMSSATDEAKNARCVSDRRTIKSEYYALKYEGDNPASTDVIKTIFGENTAKITESGDNYCVGICPSDGKYTFETDDEGRLTITCSIHNSGDLTADSGGNTLYGKDFIDPGKASTGKDSGGTYYYREAEKGTGYYINGKYYVVYEDLTERNTHNTNEGYTDIDYLANNGYYVVEIKGENYRDDVTSSNYTQKSFIKGAIITYNGETYVCIKPISDATTSNNPEDGKNRTSFWFKL